MTLRGLLLLALCGGAGCAWDEGEPFGILEAEVEAALAVPGDRDLGDGWQALASDYEVRFDRFTVVPGELALTAAGSGGAQVFDPARPPPGYSLCHAGHCHRDDGALIPYEEIEAELAGGGDGAQVLAVLRAPALELVAGTRAALDCVPDCDLPRADVTGIQLPIERITVAGEVRDGRAEPRLAGEQSFAIEAVFEPALVVGVPLALPLGRDHDPEIGLRLELAPTSALFDRIDWADLPGEPLGLDAAALERLVAAIAAGELRITPHIDR